MAKILLKPALDDFGVVANVLTNQMASGQHNAKSATYVESQDNGDKIVFSGTGFSYDGSNNLTGGVITEIAVRNASGQAYGIFTDVHIKAARLPDFATAGLHAELFDFLIAGDDKVIGTNGKNYMWAGDGNDVLLGRGGDDMFGGGAGDDRMTGGGGRDTFQFSSSNYHDVITDFHGTGPDALQEVISCFVTFTLKKAGDDVIIDFNNANGTVRLLDVRLAEVRDDIFFQV